LSSPSKRIVAAAEAEDDAQTCLTPPAGFDIRFIDAAAALLAVAVFKFKPPAVNTPLASMFEFPVPLDTLKCTLPEAESYPPDEMIRADSRSWWVDPMASRRLYRYLKEGRGVVCQNQSEPWLQLGKIAQK
jgi:hypothetical protein